MDWPEARLTVLAVLAGGSKNGKALILASLAILLAHNTFIFRR
ncbi:hypothetical protein HRbin02_01040 [Candidatus Calditenuaceae archaeon HR02]|nr:hypothetical protein HRbin02_01040 [Candidatus Calditenuaceae archaeon HR02]